MKRCFAILVGAALAACVPGGPGWAQPAAPSDDAWTGAADQKLWGLMTVWAEVKYTFPHFDRMPDLDWDRTVQGYIPRVLAAEDMDAYYAELLELVALLRDGHTVIVPPWGYLKPDHDLAPIEVRVLDDRFYVDRVGERPELAEQDIGPGAEILEIEGSPASEYFADKVLRYHAQSSKQGDEAFFTVYLLFGPAGGQTALRIQDPDGREREVTVTRDAMSGAPPFMTRLVANIFAGPTIRTRMLPGGVQYVEIPNFDHQQASRDFAALVDSLDDTALRGMIIDLRYNMGGSSAIVEPMVACLIDRPVSTPVMKFRHFVGAHEAWGNAPVWETASGEIQPREGKRYLGPLVLLTGGLTNSSAEDFVIELRDGGRATVVGQTTAGSAGNALESALPGGGTLRVATFTALIPGGEEYVGVGVAPDVEVWPTREDLAAGRDVVLERALELLRE
jgi:C-terminal processing protease CtpA/Prc